MISAQSRYVQVHEQDSRAAISSPGIQPIPAINEVGDYQAGQGSRPHGRPVAPSLSGLGQDPRRLHIRSDGYFFLFFFLLVLSHVFLCLAELVVGGYEAEYLLLLYVRYGGT